MGDPLSTIASVIAIAQISGVIVSLCYDYQKGIKNAHKDINHLQQETASLRNATEQLIKLLDRNDARSTYPSLHVMMSNGDFFDYYRKELEGLETQLRVPVDKGRKLRQRLLWPLAEQKLTKHLEMVHRLKDIIHFNISTDTARAVTNIQKDTRVLREQTRTLLQQEAHLLARQELDVMLDWLNAPDPSARHNRLLAERMETTGSWLLEHDAVREWYNSASTIWLRGIPGCGKSVLSSVLIDDLQRHITIERPNTTAMAYYQFDFSDKTISSPEMMLRSLLSQLCCWNGSLPTALKDYARSGMNENAFGKLAIPYHKSIPQPSISRLLTILHEITTKEYDRIFLVLDALDECEYGDELEPILDTLLSWRNDGVHLFLTGRGTTTLVSHLEAHTTVRTIEVKAEHVDRDIDCYVRRQVQCHPRLRGWPSALRKDIRQKLTEGAQGMFRWVVCHMANLSKCITVKDIKATLSSLPQSLTATYTTTLKNIDEMYREYAIKILMWLAISPTPLSIKEAADILVINLEDQDHPIFDEDLRIPNPMDIVKICTTLVDAVTTRHTRPNGRIAETTQLRLAHYTVKEYLLSDVFQVMPTMIFSAKQDLYKFAASTSLSYLLDLQQPLTSKIHRCRPLARHAAESWIHYYLRAGENSTLNRLAMELLKENGDTEPYMNWCRLVDLDKPWAVPNLQRRNPPKPIYYMSSEGVLSLVRQLLSFGADLNSEGQVHANCLQAAAYRGHSLVLQALLDAGVSPTKDFCYKRVDLHSSSLDAAAAGGHVDIVKLLLQRGVNPNQYRLRWNVSALYLAASRNHLDTIRALMEGGANPNHFHPKTRNKNPLGVAARRGYLDAVTLMLPRVAEGVALDGLKIACEQRNIELIKLFAKQFPASTLSFAAGMAPNHLIKSLLEQCVKQQGTSTNLQSNSKSQMSSALVKACANGHIDIAEGLIKRGADINEMSHVEPMGFTDALCASCFEGHIEVAQLLLTHGASSEINTALHIAIYKGHTAIMKILIDHGASFVSGDVSYGGPVQAAVLGHHIDILEFIVDAGADVNMRLKEAQMHTYGVRLSGSPLIAAIRAEDLLVVNWLLNHGADVNLASNMESPLEVAAKQGNMQIVRRLLEAFAEPNLKIEGYGGAPALFWAVQDSHLDIVRILLEAGADPRASSNQRYGEMHTLTQACMGTDNEIVHEMLEAGADTRQFSRFEGWNEPPIHTAASRGTGEIIRLLVEFGADVNEQLDAGETPLHCAGRWGNTDAIRALLDLHADATLRLTCGSLPIHSAASRGKLECVSAFVAAGVDINVRATTGRTPLHWAAAAEIPFPDLVEWLITHGADENLEEFKTGLTARDLARLGIEASEYREERARLLSILDGKLAKEGVFSQADADADSADDTDDTDDTGEL